MDEVYVASSDLSGWIHASTLALLGADNGSSATLASAVTTGPAHRKPAKLKVNTSSKKTPGIKDFEKYMLKDNARTSILKGYIPFTKAEPLENSDLQVTVSNMWLEKSKARQKSSLITIHTKWKKAVNNVTPKVIAVDSNGNEVLNYPG